MARRDQWESVERGISQSTRDGRFRVRIVSPREMTRTLPAGATLDDARHARAELRERAALGSSTSPTREHGTVAHYAAGWMEIRRAATRGNTADTYRVHLERHILPHIGHMRVVDVTRDTVQAWVAWAQDVDRDDGEPYSRSTVMGWWSTLKQVLGDMAADHDIPDPCRRVRPPRRPRAAKREARTLTGEELQRLVEAAALYAPERHLEIVLLAATGMRLAEMLNLEWAHVTLHERTLRVAQGKTDAAVREVVIPHEVADMLRSHRRAQLAAGVDSPLVFPPWGEDGPAKRRSGGALARRIVHLAEDIGIQIRVTPLVLRRTYNAMMVARGVDRIALRGQVGHTREDMTDHYSGAARARGELKGRKAAAADEMARVLWGVR